MKKFVSFMFTLLLCSGISVAKAEEIIQLEDTVISGNQEMPGVLYIVPSKELSQQPVAADAIRPLPLLKTMPLDPENFRIELAYRNQLQNLLKSQTEKP